MAPEIFRPLPPKEIEMKKPYMKRVLFYDPSEMYPLIADKIDHFKRVQSISIVDMFPSIPGVCACGCGTVLEGRRTRWGADDCASFAEEVRAIICGHNQVIGAYVRAYYGWECIRGCQTYDTDIDHILPVKLGGGGCWLSNYQPLCKPCHKAKTIEDFNWKMPKLPVVDENPFEQLSLSFT